MTEDVPDSDATDDADTGTGDATPEHTSDAPPGSGDHGGTRRIYRRQIEPDADDPYLALLHAIAELERCAVQDLPPLYDYVDHLVENLFDTPPPAKAQVELAFTYYDYRVTLDQEGHVSLLKQSDPLETPDE